VRGNFQATLAAEVTANRAKIVSAPRVTAINNLTAEIASQTSRPVVLTDTQIGIGGQVGIQQRLIFINTSVALTVTPTINNDDTVTVLMQPQFQTQDQGTDATLGAGQISSNIVRTVANVRDGQTIALGGLRVKNSTVGGSKIPLLSDIPLIGGLFRSRTRLENDDDLIIFLTARIVRRQGDEAAVVGADLPAQ
jgi:general secretion pathway protein D